MRITSTRRWIVSLKGTTERGVRLVHTRAAGFSIWCFFCGCVQLQAIHCALPRRQPARPLSPQIRA